MTYQYQHGDAVECEIKGTPCKGRISIDYPDSLFICQNEKNGVDANDKLGYKYSWHVRSDLTCLEEEDVTNLRLITPPKEEKYRVGMRVRCKGNGFDRTILPTQPVFLLSREGNQSVWNGLARTERELDEYYTIIPEDETIVVVVNGVEKIITKKKAEAAGLM